jgi:OTU domain-containing protein 6
MDKLGGRPIWPFKMSTTIDPPENIEALQARHRKEQRDLVARTTQKKKSATKKTRKGVNDECDRLEQELKERQAQEVAALSGETAEEAPETDPAEGKTNSAPQAADELSPSAPHAESLENPESLADGAKKKPNRAKARLARRAAEQEALAAQAASEAANLPDLREQERTQMRAHLAKHSLREKEIRADGHCLYAAVADQMEDAGWDLKPRIQPKINGEDEAKLEGYKRTRHAAADWIERNPDDFVPFMEEPLPDYVRKIRETGEWGGHMELLALASTYSTRINVLHGDGRVDKIEPATEVKDGKEIWLGYYIHNFGLGEHYNSLRKAP